MGGHASSPQLKALQEMLAPYAGRTSGPPEQRKPLTALLADCKAIQAGSGQEKKWLGTIHHFACTGGTLISRAIAAQANVTLLSEIDPYSSMIPKPGTFVPTDILAKGDIGIRARPTKITGAVFLAGLEALHVHLRKIGHALILRDHSHSHFCIGQEFQSRPLINDLLEELFEVRSVLTVRHPIDSFLPLLSQKWVQFEPETLEEYCQRYHRFLDSYDDKPLFRYEDFVGDPDGVLREILAVYQIPYTDNWQYVLPEVVLSGNSGRSGNQIAPRPRREIPESLKTEHRNSPSYDALCVRLGYNPSLTAAPLLTEAS